RHTRSKRDWSSDVCSSDLKKHRALGLGVLGWHSYLQSNHLSFECQQAAKKNLEIHKHIEEKAWEASRELAKDFGEPEILEGYGKIGRASCRERGVRSLVSE